MSRESSRLDLASMRRAFDAQFERGLVDETEPGIPVLAVRIGIHLCGLRVRELSGLSKCGRLVGLPSRFPELLGLMGLRGEIVPVFDLAALLGYGKQDGAFGWVAFCASEQLVGFALSEFLGHHRVLPSAIRAAHQTDSLRAHVREVVEVADAVIPLVEMTSVVASLLARTGKKELSK